MLQKRDREQRQGELDSKDGLQCTVDESTADKSTADKSDYLHGVTWSSRKMFGVQGRAIYLVFLLFTVQFSDGETRLEKTVFPFSWGHRLPPLEYNHTCWH